MHAVCVGERDLALHSAPWVRKRKCDLSGSAPQRIGLRCRKLRQRRCFSVGDIYANNLPRQIAVGMTVGCDARDKDAASVEGMGESAADAPRPGPNALGFSAGAHNLIQIL